MQADKYIIFLLGICSLFAVLFHSAPPVEDIVLPPYESARTTQVKSQSPDSILLKETSLEWNINTQHQQSTGHITSLPEALGAGACILDANNDGWMDIFFIGGNGHRRFFGKKSWWSSTGSNQLLINQEGHGFIDHSKASGLEDTNWGIACTAADFNNDGHTDVFIAGYKQNIFYQNNGDGSFTNITDATGISSTNWSTGAAVADINRDGLLDFYLTNYIHYKKNAVTFERSRGFKTTQDVAFDPTLYDAQANHLYINKGNFKFENLAIQYEVDNPHGRSLSAKWDDINDDGWPDLFVINDQGSPNKIFINDNGKKFSSGNHQYSPFEFSSARSLSITNISGKHSKDYLFTRQSGFHISLISQSQYDHTSEQNLFSDVARLYNLTDTSLLIANNQGLSSGDFDNNGLTDIYIANGSYSPHMDSPYFTQGQSNHLLLNHKKNVEAQRILTSHPTPFSSRAVLKADFNNDGRLEILVTNNNDKLQLFETIDNNPNSQNNNWIGLDFADKKQHAEYYGATVKLKTISKSLKRTFSHPSNYLSSEDHRLHFGLGQDSRIDELVVEWPDKQISKFKDIDANQYYSINKTNNALTPSIKNFTSDKLFDRAFSSLENDSLLHLATILAKAPTAELTGKKLSLVWQQLSPENKIQLLEDETIEGIRKLLLIKNAVYANDDNVKKAAINKIKQLELEESVRWLSVLIQDENNLVACAAMDTLRHFYQEEEAAIKSKFLAITPIIRTLNSENDAKIYCALSALDEAERYRTKLPVLKLALSNKSVAVRRKAIETLGRIRDTSVIPAIVDIVENEATPPSLIAASLSTLDKLNYDKLPLLVDKHLFNSQVFSAMQANTPEQTKMLKTIQALYEYPEHINIRRESLNKALNTLLNFQAKEQDSATTVLATLDTIAASQTAEFDDYLLQQMDSQEAEIKHLSIKVALTSSKPVTRNKAESALKRVSHDQLTAILKDTSSRTNYSTSFYQYLASQCSQTQGQQIEIFGLLQQLPDNFLENFLQAYLDLPLNDQDMQNAISAFAGFGFIPPSLNKKLSRHKNDTLRHRYAEWYFSNAKPSNDKIVNLESKIMLNSVLNSKAFTQQDKENFTILASQYDPALTQSIIPRMLTTLSETNQIIAVQTLLKNNTNSNAHEHLESILKNQASKTENRFKAAQLLAQSHPEKSAEYLSEIFNSL